MVMAGVKFSGIFKVRSVIFIFYLHSVVVKFIAFVNFYRT